MIDKSEKYFSDTTIEFITAMESINKATESFLNDMEENREQDEENLAFLHSLYTSM